MQLTFLTRNTFQFFVAHVLLVDSEIAYSLDTCNALYSTLLDFFSLVCSLSGPARVPLFGIVVITSESKVKICKFKGKLDIGVWKQTWLLS